MNHRHIKAVILLPYEAIIKAPEIAALTEEWMLSSNNDSERAITDSVMSGFDVSLNSQVKFKVRGLGLVVGVPPNVWV